MSFFSSRTRSSFRSFDSSDTSKTDKSPEEIEFHCRFRILYCLSDNLYETYRKYKTTKELWIALEDVYSRNNEGAIRFIISDFSNFRITDNIPINDQIHHFQNLIQEIHKGGSTLDEN